MWLPDPRRHRPARAIHLLLVGALVAFAVLSARGQRSQPGQPTSPPRDTPAQQSAPQAPSAVISGRVLAADTGRPLRRVRVLARAPELPDGRGVLTDDGGAFELSGLPAGRYTLSASKTGFVSLSFGQRRPLQPGTPLQLAEGERMGPLEFRLPRGSVIAGRVVDDGGEPVPGATVRVLRSEYAQGSRQLVPVGTAQADDKGQFRVWGLNPGDYYVSAQARGGGPGLGGRPFPGGRGFGGPGGQGGPAARPRDPASAPGDDPDAFDYAPTYYPGVPSVAEARPVTLGVGSEATDIDFSLLLVRTSRIAGRVSNADGSPATGGVINLAADGQTARGGPGYATRIDWEGRFVLASVPPGRYTVRARTDDTTVPQFASQPLTVSGDIPDLALVLMQPGSLDGTVSIVATQSGVPPDTTQFRISAPSTETSGIGPQPSARPDKDGRFSLDGLPPGRHWIRAQSPRGWRLASVRVDGQDVTDTPVDIAAGRALKGLTVSFTDKLSELNGTVGDQRGTPLIEYTVLVFSTDADYWRTDSRHVATARPDQTGHFQIRGLPPGEYYVTAIDPTSPGEWFDPAFLEQHRAGAERATLSDGGVTSQNIRITVR